MLAPAAGAVPPPAARAGILRLGRAPLARLGPGILNHRLSPLSSSGTTRTAGTTAGGQLVHGAAAYPAARHRGPPGAHESTSPQPQTSGSPSGVASRTQWLRASGADWVGGPTLPG